MAFKSIKIKLNIALLVLTSFVLSKHAIAQNNRYFQQGLEYKIDVELDDIKHRLKGNIEIQYTNNSDDTLTYILMHLYPNAYKNDRTAFSKQLVQEGRTSFYFSKAKERGYIKDLNFSVNGQSVNTIEYNNWADVAMLELNEKLLPGQSIQIKTPFTVKIPAVFSRLGHEGQNYNITQWYPKPAVYDHHGWHAMPYLDQGEFYSEFAKYNVNVTLPENYFVSASAACSNVDELKHIEDRIAGTKLFKPELYKFDSIPSSFNKKTLHFEQDNVHDFAWFASKYFLIEEDSLLLNQKTVHSYIYYLPENYNIWHHQCKVINHTLQTLSEKVGTYPYNIASAVDGGLEAGSGMEYPCITVVGKVYSKETLKTVLIHEVGHNWFYGILGSNERDFPWMDESINTFYENQIDPYTTLDEDSITIEKYNGNQLFNNGNLSLYSKLSRHKLSQAGDLPAEMYNSNNYGCVIYGKNAASIYSLQSHLGDSLFQKCMRYYFEQFRFKHPYPNDMKLCFETTAKQNLAWFFDTLMHAEAGIDFKIKKVSKQGDSYQIQVLNCSGIPANVKLLTRGTSKGSTFQSPVFKDSYTFSIPDSNKKFTLYSPLDNNPYNNQYDKTSLFKKSRISVRGLGKNQLSARKLYLAPAIGYNHYDKLMAGLLISNFNRTMPTRFRFHAAPMYSFASQNLVGTFYTSQNWYFRKKLKKIEFGILGGRFHMNASKLNINSTIETKKDKLTPFIEFTFKPKNELSNATSVLRFKPYFINEEVFDFILNPTDSLYRPQIEKGKWNNINVLEFQHVNSRTFNRYEYKAYAQIHQNWSKYALEAQIRLDYYMPGKALNIRGFAGKFINHSTQVNNSRYYLNGTFTGANDYLYDEYFVGRNEQRFTSAHQIQINEGGFKTPTPFLINPIGRSQNWLTALNIESDIPVKLRLPISFMVYADLATFSDAKTELASGANGIFNAGLKMETPLGSLYIPLYMSKDYSDYFKTTFPKKQQFWQTLTFRLSPSIFSHKIVKSY